MKYRNLGKTNWSVNETGYGMRGMADGASSGERAERTPLGQATAEIVAVIFKD